MIQPTLPLTHTADPATSHEAEARHVRSGKLGRNCRRVLALVVRWPERTGQELFELCIDNRAAALIVGFISAGALIPRGQIIAYARLRAEILRRLRDLDGCDLIERVLNSDGEPIKRRGACVWRPTWRGTLENSKPGLPTVPPHRSGTP